MNIEDIPIPEKVKDIILTKDNISTLYPPQAKAIEKGVLDGQNIILAIPTAAGKTLIAEMAAVKHIIEKKGKVLYLAPLRALANEKYEDFKRFNPLGIKITITSGEYDTADYYLQHYDWILATNEKMDAILRHNTELLDQITCIIVDELHLISDPSRGPTLEILLTKILELKPSIQIIGLSATINNAIDIALWLQADYIVSDWRPVPLREGIALNNSITYTSGEKTFIKHDFGYVLASLAIETIIDDGQVLIFTNSRRNTVSIGKKIAPHLPAYLDIPTKRQLNKVSHSLQTSAVSDKDTTTKTLASLVKDGIAFHHAGLTKFQRKTIEKTFKDSHIKIIVATPTLSAGVNLPARRVIISSVNRYTMESGRVSIPVFEFEQMCGRAGRPKYDSFGEAILLARTQKQMKFLQSKYLHGSTEPVMSKLQSEPALRSLILGLIATKNPIASSLDDIHKFVSKTLFSFQNETSLVLLEQRVENIVDFMIDNGFLVKDEEELTATLLGSRVSQLYLDPLSAKLLKDGILYALTTPEVKITELSFLHLLASTPDMRVLFIRKKEKGDVEKVLEQCVEELLLETLPEPYTISYDKLLIELKVAMLLEDWISETNISEIIKKFSIGRGDLNRIVDVARWIAYSLKELGRILFRKQTNKRSETLFDFIKTIEMRIEYGASEELLELCQLKGLGRIKSRELFRNGIKSVTDLSDTPDADLLAITGIGPELLKDLRQQLENKQFPSVSPKLIPSSNIQSTSTADRKQPKKTNQNLLKFFNT